jgi:hypothetical protein
VLDVFTHIYQLNVAGSIEARKIQVQSIRGTEVLSKFAAAQICERFPETPDQGFLDEVGMIFCEADRYCPDYWILSGCSTYLTNPSGKWLVGLVAEVGILAVALPLSDVETLIIPWIEVGVNVVTLVRFHGCGTRVCGTISMHCGVIA